MGFLHTIHIPAAKHLRSLYYRSGLHRWLNLLQLPSIAHHRVPLHVPGENQRRILLVAGLIDGALARADQPESVRLRRCCDSRPTGSRSWGMSRSRCPTGSASHLCRRYSGEPEQGCWRSSLPRSRKTRSGRSAIPQCRGCLPVPPELRMRTRIGRRAAAVEGSDRLIHQDILFFQVEVVHFSR